MRFISEAQPSLRLKRLLDFDRFDDALEFAKKHDLPLDVSFYTSEMQFFYNFYFR